MSPWETVLLAFGGNAALLAILAILAKSLLEKLIVRDTKIFESELKSKTDGEIERLKSEMTRNVESYKIQLKKSEFLFEREYAAALEFESVVRSIVPRPSRPDMDCEDAMQEVIDAFERTERRLDAFLTSWGPVLNDDERTLLRSAISMATDGKFYGSAEGDPAGYQTAESLCNKVTELETRLINRVRGQSSL